MMGSFHTRKLSFFLQCVLLSFFSRLAIRSALCREGVFRTPTEGTCRPVYSQAPSAPAPPPTRPSAPGFQAGTFTPQKRPEKRQRGEPNPQPDCGNRHLRLPWVEARWFSKARPERGMAREGWRTGADPAGRGGGDRLLPGPAASFFNVPGEARSPTAPGSSAGEKSRVDALLIFLFFYPPRFHSFASGPSVLETKSNTALKIMIPNILIAPFGDKVTGAALYRKTLQPDYKATSTFIFRKTMAETLEPNVPSGSSS